MGDKLNNVVVEILEDGKVQLTIDPETAKIDPDTGEIFLTAKKTSYVMGGCFWDKLDNGMELNLTLLKPNVEGRKVAKAAKKIANDIGAKIAANPDFMSTPEGKAYKAKLEAERNEATA